MDGEGEKAAQRGEAGGVGGVQGHRARRTSKQDMLCTFPDTCKNTLMRFGEGTESSAHLFHANCGGRPSIIVITSTHLHTGGLFPKHSEGILHNSPENSTNATVTQCN